MNRLLLLLAIVMLTGCMDTVIENPLVDPEACQAFPELHGVYKSVDNKSYLHIGTAGDQFPSGFLKIVAVTQPDKKQQALSSESFVCFAEKIDDSYLVHFPIPTDCLLEKQLEKLESKWNGDKISAYYLFRAKRNNGGLSLTLLDSKFIEQQIEDGKTAGLFESRINKTKPAKIGQPEIRIQASTKTLRQYFQNVDLDKAFENHEIKYRLLR